MINTLEEELFKKIATNRLGGDISIKISDAMLCVSKVEEFEREVYKMKYFSNQFEKWYKNKWDAPNTELRLAHEARSIFRYIHKRSNEVKNSLEPIGGGDKFLIENPFQEGGREREMFMSWMGICALRGIKNINLLSDGENIEGCFKYEKKFYFFDTKEKNYTEFKKNHNYIRYPKTAIVSEILTYRAKREYIRGEFNLATKDCNKALIITPNYISSIFIKGKTNKKKARELSNPRFLKKALKDFKKLIEIKPDHWNSYLEMMEIYYDLNQPKKADECKMRSMTIGGRKLYEIFDDVANRLKKHNPLIKNPAN